MTLTGIDQVFPCVQFTRLPCGFNETVQQNQMKLNLS